MVYKTEFIMTKKIATCNAVLHMQWDKIGIKLQNYPKKFKGYRLFI